MPGLSLTRNPDITSLSPASVLRTFSSTRLCLYVRAANAALVFCLIRLLSGRDLFLAAFVAVFFLSLICYHRYRESGRPRYYAACLTLFLLALLSKPMALSLPLVMLAIDFHRGRVIDKSALIEELPFALLFVRLFYPVALDGLYPPPDKVDGVLTFP